MKHTTTLPTVPWTVFNSGWKLTAIVWTAIDDLSPGITDLISPSRVSPALRWNRKFRILQYICIRMYYTYIYPQGHLKA